MTSPQHDITSEKVAIQGQNLCLHRWPVPAQPAGLAVVYHGFLAHGRYPTVRYAADRLYELCQFAVVSADLAGHGQSDGLPGYLESATAVVQQATAICQHVQTAYYPNLANKTFLVGSSMGGTIALAVSTQIAQVRGVILLAPMLQLSVSDPEHTLLQALSWMIPTWSLIPSSSTSAEAQYRDADKRRECEEDPLTVKSSTIRIGSAATCVELTKGIAHDKITAPLLIMVADQDVVVKNAGCDVLMEKAASTDKTIQHYPALHGLLCEPPPLIERIEKDLVDWVKSKC